MGDYRIHLHGVTRTAGEAELAEYHQLYSDLYKDVHGFRPRNDVGAWALDDYRSALDGLSDQFAEVMAEEAERAQAERLANVIPTRGEGWALADWE